MNTQPLTDAVAAMLADFKGVLAMDERVGTCNERFEKLGIPQTEEARRASREMLVTTPNLGASIGGAILCDETIHQQTRDGTPFIKVLQDAGIIPGIKADLGTTTLARHPGEKVPKGLDGLRDRLAEYARMGVRSAKWRAVIAVGHGLPSRADIEANHTLRRDREVTEGMLHAVFEQLAPQGMAPEGIILKPNMVLPGSASSDRHDAVDEGVAA